MSYVKVVAGAVVPGTEGGLPGAAKRLDNGAWVMNLRDYATVAQQQACGWYQVVTTTRPADTASVTYDRSITLPGGVPTETWTQRAKTAGELSSDTQGTNQTSLLSKAVTALTNNDAYVPIGATATNVQVRDQVLLLTKENSAVIRLLLARLFGQPDKLDTTSGT